MILKPNYTKNQWNKKLVNKINKPLANMTKWRREKTQINKIREEIGDKYQQNPENH
jgi:hypothetical protein